MRVCVYVVIPIKIVPRSYCVFLSFKFVPSSYEVYLVIPYRIVLRSYMRKLEIKKKTTIPVAVACCAGPCFLDEDYGTTFLQLTLHLIDLGHDACLIALLRVVTSHFSLVFGG